MHEENRSLSDPEARDKARPDRPSKDPLGDPTEVSEDAPGTQEQSVAVATAPRPKRVFVTGGHGMLGSDLVIELQGRGWSVTAPNIKEFDLTRPAHLETLRRRDFGNLDWVVNCAAYTDVDKAETHFMEAHQVNGVAPGALAFICDKNDWRFLQVSTDFVFDGLAKEPYTERHIPDPQSRYGVSKFMGEKNAFEHHAATVVARTAWLYGPNGKSFPRTMIKAWLEGKDLKVVNDQTGSPTYTADLARVLADLIALDAPGGVYHAAGPDAMSWHEFACLAIETYRDSVLGEPRKVEVAGIPASEWPSPVPRPAYSVLSFDHTASLGVRPMRSTAAALLEFCQRLPQSL